MPRITPLRVVVFPLFCYITLIILWVTLPSPPSVHGGNNGHYYQDVLRKGQVLTSTYRNINLYKSPKNDENPERDWFAIDWQLVKHDTTNAVFLRIGADTDIDLTRLANVTAPYKDASVVVTAKSGILDGVMMPWFEEADSCLLSWEIDRVAKVIEVRAIVTEQGVVQIWPEHSYWQSDTLEVPAYNSDLKPFLTLSNMPLAGDKTDISQIEVDDMTWYVPTRSFPIRRWILLTLRPTIPVTAFLVQNLIIAPIRFLLITLNFIFLYALLYGAVVFVCWLAYGRPKYTVWAGEFVLTKWFQPRRPTKKTIWGPGGFIEQVDDEGGLEREVDAHLSELGTLHSPVDFFRSRSPLDELLNTFQMTRWMVQPLDKSGKRVRNRFEPSDGIKVNLTKDRIIKQDTLP